ncbi:MAG: 16S rRNA (cytosine(1402)-N(4))-methyltransferase RsmH [Emcibacter sp.]|nr:16S rRNA (cytosine(1402)-N(4))-methyltransferase RsmH [Emcibacter sp.]
MTTQTETSHDPRHYPVMRDEVLEQATPGDGEIFIDGTFGAGGYSRALLEAANCTVYAIDRDPAVQATAEQLAAEFPGRFYLLPGCFSQMDELLQDQGVEKVDGVLLDIGVSSMQFDDADRGFSFQNDGPLSMRMSDEGLSAEDVVNERAEGEIADIIYQYGEEKKSRRIAKAIVEARSRDRITRTTQLAGIIEKSIGYKRYIRGKNRYIPPHGHFRPCEFMSMMNWESLAGGLWRRNMFWRRADGYAWCPFIRWKTGSSKNSSNREVVRCQEGRVICRKQRIGLALRNVRRLLKCLFGGQGSRPKRKSSRIFAQGRQNFAVPAERMRLVGPVTKKALKPEIKNDQGRGRFFCIDGDDFSGNCI